MKPAIIALLGFVLLGSGCTTTNETPRTESGIKPPYISQPTTAKAAAPAENVLTIDEAKNKWGDTQTIEMEVAGAGSFGSGQVVLQNFWGYPGDLAALPYVSMTMIQEHRVPSSLFLVVLPENVVEELKKSGVTDVQSRFVGTRIRATGRIEVLGHADSSLPSAFSRSREWPAIRITEAAQVTIQKDK